MAKKAWNHMYYAAMLILAILAAIPPGKADALPEKYKPWVEGIIGAAVWFKAHRNLLAMPPDRNNGHH